jgi:hypothetical protein
MSIRSLKWILLGPALALLLLEHGFAGNLKYGVGSWEVPPGQPDQMWSRVDYDPKLTDPFFKSNKWSYPWYIIKHPDGHFEDTRGKRPKKEPPRLKHTANCFSAAGGAEHLLRFCEARFLDPNGIDLLIHETNPSYIDALRVQIRNGMFACQYWAKYRIRFSIKPGTIWTTKRQKLTLDKKAYRKGDTIKGRIDFECVEEATNPSYVEKYGKNPTTIKLHGVFRTIVE